MCTFCLYSLKDVTLAFVWCFSWFNWFSYCRGNCICAGEGNTIVSHFVVKRADLIVAIVCFPCGSRRSLICACEWGFWVCWKLSAAVRINPDCRLHLLWSPFLTDSAACSLPLHFHYIYIIYRYLYCHVSGKIYIHMEWGMVLRAFIIIHTFAITLTG